MRIFISILLIIFISLLLQCSYGLLQIKRNMDSIDTRIGKVIEFSQNMKDMNNWYNNIPMQNKVKIVGG